jgi:hypothetical protein
MAHLWYENEAGHWTLAFLREAAVALGSASGVLLDSEHAGGASALLLRSRIATTEQWLLMNVSLQPLSVNGEVLRTGIRALNNRDEICGKGIGRIFFATERLAAIEAFPGSEREHLCPRCRLGIVAGTPTIRCVSCGTAFHQDVAQDLCCFTYGEKCPLCGNPTVLSETYRFQPDEL